MSFLDSAQGAAEEGGPPSPQPAGGGGAQQGPQGGGPILAALANRQRGPRTSAPGAGDMASSLSLIQTAISLMNQALPGLMGNTQVYQDTLKALQRLSRHVPEGAPAEGQQRTQIEDLLRNVVKNALLTRVVSQQQRQGGQPGGAPGAPGGAPAQAPMPATPLPGA